MTVEMMQTLSLILYILAGVLAVTAIVLFIALRVPRIIGELTGSAERKAIENIRKQNVESASQDAEHHRTQMSGSQMTDKISRSGRLAQRETRMSEPHNRESLNRESLKSSASGTQKLGGQRQGSPSAETEVLHPGMGETELLRPAAGETEVLGRTAGETEVLNPDMVKPLLQIASVGETTLLPQTTPPTEPPTEPPAEGPVYGETSRLQAPEIRQEVTIDHEIQFSGSSEWIE